MMTLGLDAAHAPRLKLFDVPGGRQCNRRPTARRKPEAVVFMRVHALDAPALHTVAPRAFAPERVDTPRPLPPNFRKRRTAMKERDDIEARTKRESADASNAHAKGAGEPGAARRELLVMRAGGRDFAVFSDEAEAVAKWSAPTPLPHAPPSVLGVVSVRGRMRTVLDPSALLDEDYASARVEGAAHEEDEAVRDAAARDEDEAVRDEDEATRETLSRVASRELIVPLRGDEQLALAVESAEHVGAPVLGDDAREGETESFVRLVFKHGDALVALLEPSQLFDAAMRGTERRRPRTRP